VLARQRAQRLATVAELDSLRARIRSSVTAEKRRYAGLRTEVRRLLEERRRAEIAASRRAAARAQAGRATAATVAVNDIGGVSAADGAAGDALPVAAVPAPSSVGAGAVGIALSQLGTPYVAGGAAPGGFDCSGLVSWAYAQAGRPGLPHFTGALWTSGTHIASQGDLAPGDLVFFDGLGHVGMYIGGGQFVESPHTGDVVKVSQLASRSDYLGAVRVSG
jgi:cell wall-associated NlpC family hydrolase